MTKIESSVTRRLALGATLLLPGLTYAQQSPFDTGANSLVTFALDIATPLNRQFATGSSK